MRREIVQPNGTLVLGAEARRHGYVPGAVVDVVVLSSGSLLVRLDDSAPLDVPYRRGLQARNLAALADGAGHE